MNIAPQNHILIIKATILSPIHRGSTWLLTGGRRLDLNCPTIALKSAGRRTKRIPRRVQSCKRQPAGYHIAVAIIIFSGYRHRCRTNCKGPSKEKEGIWAGSGDAHCWGQSTQWLLCYFGFRGPNYRGNTASMFRTDCAAMWEDSRPPHALSIVSATRLRSSSR